mgnify:FL=1
MKKETIKIRGMSCAACAKRIEKAVGGMEGVKSATVNFATEMLTLEFDEQKAPLTEIKKTIENTGYNVIEKAKIKHATIPIGGMTCAACASRIERVLGKTEGIKKASVNLSTEKATVEYDPEIIRLSAIKQAINKLGYKALSIEKNTVDEDKIRKEREIKTLLRKFIIAAIFALPLLYIAMGPMISLPIPSILDPMHKPLNYALTQIILVIPVLIAGNKFYSVGFRSLIQREPNMDSLIAIGTSAAVIYSLYSTIKIIAGDHIAAHEGLYFESAGVIITLILLGKYLETVTKGKTSEAIKKLMGLAPKTAIVLQDGVETELPIDEVEVGT